MILRSAQYDDVYFSVDGGMAETHHVFINGNGLPQAWHNTDHFTIAETGFGTGLNILCAWALFEQTSASHQKLHFISVEKFPLDKEEIRTALSPWRDVLGRYLDRLLDLYPLRVPGPHLIRLSEKVSLTLWFGDMNDMLPHWTGQIDAWFLDGFTPAKNPDMWTDTLFSTMACLSHQKTTFASFTAAGDVRRGLEKVGFHVEKSKGFGRKRDMIRGYFKQEINRNPTLSVKTMAVIGGGLAGCAMAYRAKQAGIHVTIHEQGGRLASGASGGKLGMINPKLTAKPSAHSDYYTAAYANALRVFPTFKDIDFQVHGSLHLCTDDDKDRRFNGYVDNLGWHSDHIERRGRDLFYPDGATLCPEKLCHALAKDAHIKLNSPVRSITDMDADFVMIANGHAANDLLPLSLPIHSVRGQVSWIKPQPDIDHNLCFGGYMTPQKPEGFHILGSSFQPWDTDLSIKDQDHKDNIGRYNTATGRHLTHNDIIGGWAALRTSSKDRFPVVGHVRDNIYISTAHGSHGIISTMYAADIILSMITDGHNPSFADVRSALSPKRFHKH